jgi:hypothetical protein
MFSDASCGTSQLFSYQFEQHFTNIQKYVHLFTGKPGETDIAVYCPTTLYRLGASLQPSIAAGYPLRDLCEYDVLDELLIGDGALDTHHHKALLIFQGDIVEQSIVIGDTPIKNVEGKPWSASSKVTRVSAVAKDKKWLKELSAQLAGLPGVDGRLDGLWTCRRGAQLFLFNSTAKPVEMEVNGESVMVAPYTIWMNEAASDQKLAHK